MSAEIEYKANTNHEANRSTFHLIQGNIKKILTCGRLKIKIIVVDIIFIFHFKLPQAKDLETCSARNLLSIGNTFGQQKAISTSDLHTAQNVQNVL